MDVQHLFEPAVLPFPALIRSIDLETLRRFSGASRIWWFSVGNFFITLIVGTPVLLADTEFFYNAQTQIRRETRNSFIWGVVPLGLFIGISQVFGILPFGSVLILLTLLLLLPVVIVGDILAFLTLFEWLVDNEWTALFLTAAVGSIFIVIPQFAIVQKILTICIGTGAIIQTYRGKGGEATHEV